MSSPAMSAVTGKALSANTRAGYSSDWALFLDWCTAAGTAPLPAEWATVEAFVAGCPGRLPPSGGASPRSRTTTAQPATRHRPTRDRSSPLRRGS